MQPTIRKFRGPTAGSLRSRSLAAGLPYMVVYLRVKRLGWDVERALSEPKASRRSVSLDEIRSVTPDEIAALKESA